MEYLTSNIVINAEADNARMIYCLPIVQYYKNNGGVVTSATVADTLIFYQSVTTSTRSYDAQVAFYYDPDDIDIDSDFYQIKQLMDASIIGSIEQGEY